MFLVSPIILLASFFGIKGGNFIYKILRFWARLWYTSVGIWHQEIYEFPHDATKQFIFVGNHISYMDVPAVIASIHQPIRVLGKYEMIKIPIFGLIYKATVILVDRRNAAKRAQSVRALKSALAKGISVFIFPEGTFNETSKPMIPFFDGAFRIAIETQTNIKPILFLDTLERMHYKTVFTLSPGKNRTIYLEEVNVIGLSLKDLPLLKLAVFTQMETYLSRFKNYDC